MATTYEPIATTTLASNTASYTFSSIPSTYTDIVLVYNFGTPSLDYLNIQFNGDATATNYSGTYVLGDGTSASSGRYSGTNGIYWIGAAISPNSTSYGQIGSISINNYKNSTTYKVAIARHNRAGGGAAIQSGLWRNTAAITSIKLLTSTGQNLVAGSTFTLYGIKAA